MANANALEINQIFDNLKKIEFVMELDNLIDDGFKLADKYRGHFSDKEVRQIITNLLSEIEENLDARKKFVSDSYFDDVRSVYSDFNDACSRMLDLYRKEIALYEIA